jgi:hypothetical protein
MEDSRKIIYEPPVTEVFVVKTEGIICSSDNNRNAPGAVPGMEHGWDLDFNR